MPWWLLGFFIAAFFGTVISHFNSIVNSTATLFAMDWHRAFRPQASDAELIRVGKMAGTAFALISMIIAPLMLYAPDGIYMMIRRVTGFYNIPIIAIVLAGFFLPRVPAWAARLVLVLHVVSYATLVIGFDIDKRLDINFVHIMGMMFAVHAVILAGCGWFWPRHGRAGTISFRLADGEQLPSHLRPWRYAQLTSVLLVCLLISMYLTFSPLGFATVGGPGLPYAMLMGALWLLFLAYAMWHLRRLERSPAPMQAPAIETA